VWSLCLWTYKEMLPCSERSMQSIKVPCLRVSTVHCRGARTTNEHYRRAGGGCVNGGAGASLVFTLLPKRTQRPGSDVSVTSVPMPVEECLRTGRRARVARSSRQLVYRRVAPERLRCDTKLNEETRILLISSTPRPGRCVNARYEVCVGDSGSSIEFGVDRIPRSAPEDDQISTFLTGTPRHPSAEDYYANMGAKDERTRGHYGSTPPLAVRTGRRSPDRSARARRRQYTVFIEV